MATVVLSVPDNLVEYAKKKGVFTEEWATAVYREALSRLAERNDDIIGPFHEAWEPKLRPGEFVAPEGYVTTAENEARLEAAREATA